MARTNLEPEEVLDNYTRAQIFNYISRNSCVNYSQIRSALGLTNGPTLHHLNILKQAGYVKTIAGGNSNFYYASGQESQLLTLLRAGNTPKTLENAIINYRKNLHSLRA